jgi:hypothetical protein
LRAFGRHGAAEPPWGRHVLNQVGPGQRATRIADQDPARAAYRQGHALHEHAPGHLDARFLPRPEPDEAAQLPRGPTGGHEPGLVRGVEALRHPDRVHGGRELLDVDPDAPASRDSQRGHVPRVGKADLQVTAGPGEFRLAVRPAPPLDLAGRDAREAADDDAGGTVRDNVPPLLARLPQPGGTRPFGLIEYPHEPGLDTCRHVQPNQPHPHQLPHCPPARARREGVLSRE